jgi:tight adherence protein C
VLFAFSGVSSFADILPVALFGLVASIVWWVLDFFAGQKSRAMERLDELRNPHRRASQEVGAMKQTDTMTMVLAKATPALAKPLEPKSEAEANQIKARLAAANFRGENAGSIFLGLKFLGLLIGAAFGMITVFPTSGISLSSMRTPAAIAITLFYLPDIVVWFLGNRRKTAVFLGLPDALDLMVVCVEAGLALDQAMRRVADEMKRSYPIIAEEFATSNFQLQMGRPRHEVLHELGSRSGVQDLRTLATVLIQADKFGTSVAQALRVQSDAMRIRRRQLAEEKAAKTAVKLIFPLVLFIFPGIFVILVGPAAVHMIRQMLPAMQGG